MSILATITTAAPRPSGLRMVIAAVEKMGKTTFGSYAPNALLVPLEVGFAGVTVPKTDMLQTFDQTVAFVDEVTYYAQRGQFPYRSIIFDSATALERQIHDNIIRRDPQFKPGAKKSITMESAHGGYGKAYNLANDEFDTLLGKLDLLAVHAGINIIFTSHVFSSKMMDPTAGEYDSWDILLHSPKNQKTYGKRERITQWADVVGFLYEPVFVSSDGNMSRAVSQNKGRVLGLSRTPSYVAGNRFGIIGEVPIPAPPENGWNVFAHALYQRTGIDVYNRS